MKRYHYADNKYTRKLPGSDYMKVLSFTVITGDSAGNGEHYKFDITTWLGMAFT